MKVKVARRELIQMVQAAKRRLREEHAERAAAYPAELEAYRERVVASLERELAKLRNGGRLPEAYCRYTRSHEVEGVIVDVGVRAPVKPTKPKTDLHDLRLRELRLETREELLVDVRDREWRGVL